MLVVWAGSMFHTDSSKLNPRNALAAVQQQMFEQCKFLVREHDQARAPARRVVQPVQFQISGTQPQPRIPLAPQQRPAACAQLMQAERLGHQVVGAPVKAAHARVYLLARGQHQHRQVGIQDTNFLEYLLAILHRHIQVKNGQIGHILAKCFHGGSAVVRHSNAVPIGFEAAAQKQPQRLVVFGYQ